MTQPNPNPPIPPNPPGQDPDLLRQVAANLLQNLLFPVLAGDLAGNAQFNSQKAPGRVMLSAQKQDGLRGRGTFATLTFRVKEKTNLPLWLGIGQIISWGSLYYPIAVLAAALLHRRPSAVGA